MTIENVQDRNGRLVKVGTHVRVTKIRSSVLARLPSDEIGCVQSMEGEVFEVYEIDDWGGAWVTKWWRVTDGESFSHSLSLASDEMEVVEGAKRSDA